MWELNASVRKKAVEVLVVMELIKKSGVRIRWGNRRNLMDRVDQSILKWFGHKEKMDDEGPKEHPERGEG